MYKCMYSINACIILYCISLCCTVLYFTVVYCTVCMHACIHACLSKGHILLYNYIYIIYVVKY